MVSLLRFRWWLIGFALPLCLLVAPAARAEWLSPVDISEAGVNAASAHVVLDSHGNATAVWERGTETDTVVEASYRPAGEGWGSPIVLPGGHEASSPQVVVDRNDNVTVLWERYAATKILLQAVERPAEGAWQQPVTIGEAGLGMDPEPQLTVDWEGNAAAVWKQAEVIQAAVRPYGHEWEAQVPISGGESFVPQVTADARGDVTAAWMHYDGSHYVVQSAYRPEGKEWEAPTLVSEAGEEAGNPHVALDANGDTLVVWRGESESEEFARAAYRPVGGGWEAPVSISAKGEQIEGLRDALSPNGDAIAVWAGGSGEVGSYEIARAAFRPAAGAWEAPESLSEGADNVFPADVVFDTAGNATVVWQRTSPGESLVQATYRPTGGAWEAATNLSEEGKEGTDPVVVLDAPGDETRADGDATAVWISATQVACGEKEFPCYTDTIQAAGYDPLGTPKVEVEVPTTGTVGEPVEISTPTEQVWAPKIEFGDGESAANTQAVHTYEEPGEYEVTFSGAEVLGYRSSVTKTITIKPSGWEVKREGSIEPKPIPVTPDTRVPTTWVPPSDGARTGECASAKIVSDGMVHRLKRTRAASERANGSVARRRWAARIRRQEAALRVAQRQAAQLCGS
jgi:PKD domain